MEFRIVWMALHTLTQLAEGTIGSLERIPNENNSPVCDGLEGSLRSQSFSANRVRLGNLRKTPIGSRKKRGYSQMMIQLKIDKRLQAKLWTKDGRIHRLDKAAVIYANGKQSWYVDGNFVRFS